jgi:hypothetical protein
MATRVLYNELRRQNAALADEFDAIYRESLKIWDEPDLREFTDHGKVHIDQVERNLDSLTRPLQSSSSALKAEEIFVLLSACCLHDIGMQLVDDPDARAKHAQYSYELILYSHTRVDTTERRVTLPITDNNARRAIALIARAHWTDYALKCSERDYIVGQERGRLRLLGELLAMADLLDISPVRARYFRSIHRLYTLPAMSELHQRMHELVKGFEIIAPNSEVQQDLQFQLEWREDGETVRLMNDWAMTWFASQWRQLSPALYKDSGGSIRWSDPWATVKYNPPEGPMPDLQATAKQILKAERSEQLRINRDRFIAQFKSAIKSGGATLFLFPSDSTGDGQVVSEWCGAQAGLENKVARVVIPPSAPLDLSSIISQLMEQWGEHLPQCRNDKALQRLRQYVLHETETLVSIIVAEKYEKRRIYSLLEVLMQSDDPEAGRVCLLLTRGAEGPRSLPQTAIVPFDASEFGQADVERYLQTRLGFSPLASEKIYSELSSLGLAQQPGQIYNYIQIQMRSDMYAEIRGV